jgi:hypothetical protein
LKSFPQSSGNQQVRPGIPMAAVDRQLQNAGKNWTDFISIPDIVFPVFRIENQRSLDLKEI